VISTVFPQRSTSSFSKRVNGDDRRRAGDRDVEHGEARGTGDERPVTLEHHPERRSRRDVPEVLDVGGLRERREARGQRFRRLDLEDDDDGRERDESADARTLASVHRMRRTPSGGAPNLLFFG
jgi:hypothetical protein